MRNEGAIKVAVPIRRKFITTTAMYFSVKFTLVAKINKANDVIILFEKKLSLYGGPGAKIIAEMT